jgi:tetratricopeptide (TPR) repeat protein
MAQTNDELYKQGLVYKAQYKNTEGLGVFQKLLKADSANVNYVYNASYFYSKCGAKLTVEADKMKYYRTAEYLAKKAIKLDGNNAETHYVYALALGRINENASSSVKIANAKLIKAEIDKCLSLNPKHAGAYHVLGRWHRTIAGFSGIEKTMINTFYGGVPKGGSYDDAVKAFQNAITYEPKYILHQYELAVTYNDMGKKEYAKQWLQNAIKLSADDDDAKDAKKKCEELLKKLK